MSKFNIPIINLSRLGTIVGTLIILGAILFNSFYIIESGTVGVLVTFGKYGNEVVEPGPHFKQPLIQNVRNFDVKMNTINYLGREDRRVSEGIINKPLIDVLDSKNLPIGLELSVQFTPIAEQANRILEQYGENYFEKLINPFVRNVVRNVVGKYQAEEIAMKRPEIEGELQIQLSKEFENTPFKLNTIGLRNINLPEIILSKIKEVQLAKQEEQRLAMVEEQAKKNQQIKTIEANTKLIEVTTQARAEGERKRIQADAVAYQIAAEAKANAEANRLIATSITRELIDYRSIDRWNGAYPQTLIGGNSTGGMILSLPNTEPAPTKSVAKPETGHVENFLK
jgi:regulator of protease activity HflC (stomatin/prohibitin superfamily)